MFRNWKKPENFLGIILFLFLIYTILRFLKRKLDNAFASSLSAKTENELREGFKNPQEQPITAIAESVVLAVKQEIDRFNQDESRIVREVNRLVTPATARYASALYKTKYGRSFRTDLQEALAAEWRMDLFIFMKGKWSDIKLTIRQNIF